MKPVSELFDVVYGHSLELNRLRPLSKADGGVAFVSRKMGDNGISAYVAPIPGVDPSPAGLLTSALGGNGVLSTFLQEEPFYSGRDMALLRPKIPLTKPQLLFYCYCIVSNRYRFSYGRQANRTLKHIMVPEPDKLPDYVDQTDITRFDGCDSPESGEALSVLDVCNWQAFTLQSLFTIRKGQRLTKANMKPGTMPYIGASDTSNGVTAHIGQDPIHKGGTISVSYNGSVAEAFYQPVEYWATDDVNVLYPKGFSLTPATGLFVCTILRMEKYRFNYGRKWHLERMRETVIKLPVTTAGTPDWAFMEEFIKALPYSSQVQ
ncbi:TPA: restriction endonuclease subunit S [Serratia fonticola]